jgi:hypothetical protein
MQEHFQILIGGNAGLSVLTNYSVKSDLKIGIIELCKHYYQPVDISGLPVSKILINKKKRKDYIPKTVVLDY